MPHDRIWARRDRRVASIILNPAICRVVALPARG